MRGDMEGQSIGACERVLVRLAVYYGPIGFAKYGCGLYFTFPASVHRFLLKLLWLVF